MKTKIKWVKAILLGAFASATLMVHAQSSSPSQIAVRELQAKRVVVNQQVIDLQSNQASINQSITQTQAQITERQNAIAQLNTLLSATTDPTEIANYNQKISGLNNDINNVLQPQITQMQAKLAAIPAAITQAQTQVTTLDNEITLAQQMAAREAAYASSSSLPAPQRTSTQPAPTNPALSTPRNPSDPSALPLLPSTGNAEQDAALLRQWLLAHPIVK